MRCQLTHLSLFSGIGGLDLAAEMAGFTTVGQCEWADYPTRVLEKHWPDVPRWRDIRTLTKESFYERTGLRTADVISGGFPCQPFSVAGKRRGKDDDRYLWPEMLRVISEIRPCWVIAENVAGIVNMALDQVLSDMESIGYTAEALVIPACAVDAPHRRDRVCIVSNANDTQAARHRKYCGKILSESEAKGLIVRGELLADTNSVRLEEPCVPGLSKESGISTSNDGWRAAEPCMGGMADGLSAWLDRGMSAPGYWMPDPSPEVPRVAHGVENRVDRMKCLGNAVVPQQFYPVFRAIADIERST